MKGRSGRVSDGYCRWHGGCAYDLVQSLCGTKTSWAGTDDEDIDVAAYSCQYCVRWLQVFRRRNSHLLAIGLAEVALVGFGPVGVVGGNARHCEESLVLMCGLVGNTGYSASRGEEREGWWRWGMETCFYSNNNNDRTSLQCKLSPTATPSGTPAARSPSHLPPINKGPPLFPTCTSQRHSETVLAARRRGLCGGVASANHRRRSEHWKTLLLLLAAAATRSSTC